MNKKILILLIIVGFISVGLVASGHVNNGVKINNEISGVQDYEITSYSSNGLLYVSITPYNTVYSTIEAEVVVTQSGTVIYDNSFKGTTSVKDIILFVVTGTAELNVI